MDSKEIISLSQKMMPIIQAYAVNLALSILILVAGWVVSVNVKKLLSKGLSRSGKLDPTLIGFICSVSYTGLMTFVIIAALGRLGVQTASMVAVLGAAGLAVGLALQGSLANFAAGVLMLIFKPFKVGDFIDGGGITGIVREIGVFTTVLNSPDNKRIIVPNNKLTTDNITNFTAEDKRRMDLKIGVSYSDDIDKVKSILMEIVVADDRVLKDPAPMVGLLEMADSSINFAVRPWVSTSQYWDVYFSLMETIKKRFDSENISIPFPQRDVHLYQK